MKPVAIFRHSPSEGPGHLTEYLDARAIPWQLIAVDAGEVVPADPRDYSGLVFMGGPMSVNDDLPWIPPVLALIRAAVETETPVLGHCLGGQLMSKALGGVVTRNPVKEIGWGAARVLDCPEARRWFGDVEGFMAFHWHGETFSLPPGAVRILESAWCTRQAFALGPHLALQCHVEMTAPMIAEWCRVGAEEVAAAQASPGVQTPEAMQAMNPAHLPALNRLAEALYSRWLEGLRP